MSITFVADKGSVCTVHFMPHLGKFFVRIGDEELTSGDLARISLAIETLNDERITLSAPSTQITSTRRRGARRKET